MATIIPALNRHTLARMTSGEMRFSEALARLLEDDYLVWYDLPIGRRRRYPDFIILHPSRDPSLCDHAGPYQGTLVISYGWGVVRTNITRNQFANAAPPESREILLPDHLVIFKGEFTENTDAEAFQERLWKLINPSSRGVKRRGDPYGTDFVGAAWVAARRS